MVPAAHEASQRPVARILVVEDEVLIRVEVADALRQAGYEVIEAGCAAEAQAYVRGGGGVDLLFSDLRMPGGMNGAQLAGWIRAHAPGVPVILASGDAGPAEIGVADAFLAKPYDIGQAVGSVARLLAAAEG
ncbi:MAG TPA: response regulator [Acetobacteraceae bacterium]|nr:response regulator [Acetobacteraceae bacterium]